MLRPVRSANPKRKHSRRPAKAGNHKRNNRLPAVTLGFLVLALLAAGIISQMPSALADDSDNPFRALWNAILNLQSRDEDLQNQIDELKAGREAPLSIQEPEFVSDLYAEIEIEASEDGRMLVYVTVGNSGPDRAGAVKVTAFYLMPLFEINSINGHQCEDKSRGIIECALGTLEEGQESVITIDATSRESGQANTWTVDVSTTTDDTDYSNNHVAYDFETGSAEPIEIPQVKQPEETGTDSEPEQDDSSSNSTSTETQESQESSGNQTSTENESEETSSENQTSSETVEDSSSNDTSSTEDDQSSGSEESSSEASESTQEEQSSESETEEQVEEQGQEE